MTSSGADSAASSGATVLTIDVGTSSVRAMLFDQNGNTVPGMEAQRVHQMHSTTDGGIETDAGELFDRMIACIDEILARAGDAASSIVAVAPTTFWHNLLGVSASGIPVTPLFTWADTRATAAASALRAQLDGNAVHARTGCVLHASYWPAKLRWLQTDRRWNKVVSTRVRRWLSFGEYVTLRVFGVARCSVSMASGTGILDQHICRWDEELLNAIPIDAGMLSDLSDIPCRGLRAEFASRWPSLVNVPWFPGWGDGATSNVGSGCVTKQRIAIMVGTSGAMRAVWRTKDVAIPRDLWCYRVDADRVVMGGALSNGGNLVEWLRATLRLPDDPAALEAALARVKPDQSGITVLPFLAGERSPGWHSEARATFSGLSLHTSADEVLRAGHEAVAYRFALVYALLRSALKGSAHVIASGGGLLHSPAWLQMMADVLGTKVTASAVPEASSRGAALLAMESIGNIPDVGSVEAPLANTYMPVAAATRRYRAAAQRQYALYDLLIRDGER